MAGREVKVAILGDAKGLITALGLGDTAVGKFFTNLQAKSALGGLALGAGVTAGVVAAGKALFDLGKQFDGAFDTLRVKTGATGKELAGLKESFKDVFSAIPTDMAPASEAIAGLNARLGLTGQPLERLAKQFLELSRITKTDVGENIADLTRLFGDWSIASEDQAKALNKVFRATQETGVGLNSLAQNVVQFGAPLRNLGFTFDQAIALFSKFEKEGVNLETVLAGMRFGLKTFAKAGEEPIAALQRVITQIKAAGSAAEANALAFEVFGVRAGPDMAAAIREGRFELDSVMSAITNGKDTIRGAARDTNDFSEQWKIFKNTLLTEVEPVATRVFTGISQAMEWVTEHRADFKRFFDDVALAVSAAWTVVEPIYKALFDQLVAVFNLIDDLIHGRWAQLWGDVVAIFEAAFNYLVAPLRGFYRLFEGTFQDVANAVWSVIGPPLVWLKARIDEIAGAVVWMAGVYVGAIDQVVGAGTALWGVIDGPLAALWSILQKIYNTARDAADAIRNIPSSIGGAIGIGGGSFAEEVERVERLKAKYGGAEGAIVNRPTLALIGEAGPEMLVPLHRAPGASPLPNGGGGVIVIENVIVLDGEVVARNSAKHFGRAGGPRIPRRAIA